MELDKDVDMSFFTAFYSVFTAFMEHGNTLKDFMSRTTYLGYVVLESNIVDVCHGSHVMLIS